MAASNILFQQQGVLLLNNNNNNEKRIINNVSFVKFQMFREGEEGATRHGEEKKKMGHKRQEKMTRDEDTLVLCYY